MSYPGGNRANESSAMTRSIDDDHSTHKVCNTLLQHVFFELRSFPFPRNRWISLNRIMAQIGSYPRVFFVRKKLERKFL